MNFQDYGINESAELMGIEPNRHCEVTGFGGTLHFHKQDYSGMFEPVYAPHLPGAVLGTNVILSRALSDNYREGLSSPQFSFTISTFPLTAKGALVKAGLGLVNTKTFHFLILGFR